MSKFSFVAAFGAMIALAGCDVAYPVSVIGQDGTVFRGAATNTFLHGGSFQATNGAITCSGTYSKHSEISTVGFPVTCSNGMRGIGTAHFQTETNGVGEVRMADGSSWQFIFGRGALAI